MEDSNKMSYFFLGLGIGVAAGVLWAPRAGEETREYLRSKANESGDFLKSRADEGTEYLRRRGEELKETATNVVERGREAVARQRDQFATAVDAGKRAYRETVAPDAGQVG